MTLCTVIRVREGVVGLGDSAVNAGAYVGTKSKLAVYAMPHGRCFTFVSGLRSISDKVASYARDALTRSEATHLFEVANLFGSLLRRVREEDASHLAQSNLAFDGHVLLAGRFSGDICATAYLIYPQGNWIEVGKETPFLVIGNVRFGIAHLKVMVTPDLLLDDAMKAGLVALDAAASVAANVGYPIDVAICANDAPEIAAGRLQRNDVAPLVHHWQAVMRRALAGAPTVKLDSSLFPFSQT